MLQSVRPSVSVVLALVIWLSTTGPVVAHPRPAFGATNAVAQPAAPLVGGVALQTTTAGGWPLHYDRAVPPAALAVAETGFVAALEAVPRVAGLPPFKTPLAVFLLGDQSRLRAAMQEIGGVRIDLVSPEKGGYTIERDGTMLIFFAFDVVEHPVSALLLFAHELAHLGVREASARRPVPQWFNEGYAQWVSYAVLREVDPFAADVQLGIDRAAVASALHSESGLLPWSSLVTRTRFSRSDTEGWVSLAYGQGTLFVDWLAQRHGLGAPAVFLRRIGDGAGATTAFQAAFGPFEAQEAAFRASLEDLKTELQPGLRRLTPTLRPGWGVLYALIGGRAGEEITFETFLDGELVWRGESLFDPAGFDLEVIVAELAARPGLKLIRVTSSSLGVLEAAVRADGTFDDAPPRQAPVQIPRAPAAESARSQQSGGCLRLCD